MTDRARLCASPRCHSRGQHWDDCNTADCAGCLPRQAARDSQLCVGCNRKLAADIASVPELHGELGLRLAHGNGAGEKVATKPGSRTPDPKIMQIRGDIRLLLTTWARIIVEQRHVEPPADNLHVIGAFLGTHATWLGQQPFANEPADQFADMQHKAWNAAYPSGTRSYEVAPCPMGCEGVIRAVLRRVDSLLPSELVCDVDSQHTWNSTQWLKLGRQLKAAA